MQRQGVWWAFAILIVSLITLCILPGIAARSSAVEIAPTSVADSALRGGPGAFGSPSPDGKKHTGVDIVSKKTSMDKNVYRVLAVSSGVVAYAGHNGKVEPDGPTKGYGYTVIIDHDDDLYTLYAHLAYLSSSNLVKVGDHVKTGQIIGYMADLAINEKSSGNVLAAVVGKYDKIQLHFEEFRAPSGRHSSASINDDIKKIDFDLIDPTSELKKFKYYEYKDEDKK